MSSQRTIIRLTVIFLILWLPHLVSCQLWTSPVYLTQDAIASNTSSFAYFFSKSSSFPVQCNVTLVFEYEMYGYEYETYEFSLSSVTANIRYVYIHPVNQYQYGYAYAGSKFSMSCGQQSIVTQGTTFLYYKPEKPIPRVNSYDYYSTDVSWDAVTNADYYQFTLKQFPFTNTTLLSSENYYGFHVYLYSLLSGQYYEFELYSFSGIKSEVVTSSFVSYLSAPMFDYNYYERFDKDAKWTFYGNPIGVNFTLCRQLCYFPQLKQCLQLNASSVIDNYQYKYRYTDLENHQCYDFTIQAVTAYANSSINSLRAITPLKDISSLNYTHLSYSQTKFVWNDNINANQQNVTVNLNCYSNFQYPYYDPNPQYIYLQNVKSPVIVNTTGDTPYRCSLQLCSKLPSNYDCTYGEMGMNGIDFKTPPGPVKNINAQDYCTSSSAICLQWDSFEGSTLIEIVTPIQRAPFQVNDTNSYTVPNLSDSTRFKFKLTVERDFMHRLCILNIIPNQQVQLELLKYFKIQRLLEFPGIE